MPTTTGVTIMGTMRMTRATRMKCSSRTHSRARPRPRLASMATARVTNLSVTHSESRLDGGTITVTVRSAADRVRVEVTDDGGPTTPTLRRDDDLAEAGRGLRLVEAYSLRWDHYRDRTRTVTWFECVPEPLA